MIPPFCVPWWEENGYTPTDVLYLLQKLLNKLIHLRKIIRVVRQERTERRIKMNDQELLKNVNPSYTTGKGCLVMLAGTGDPDAIELSGIIDLSELPQNDPMPENQTTRDIVRSYMVGQDARYSVWNQIAADSDCDVIIDLPCGYLPHGLAVARMGKTYYGFDLPVVINDIEPAIYGICEKEQDIPRERIHYRSVDATNYESMKRALDGVKGRICIITDGMLALFNRSELDEACRAVRKLLSDFDGEWYTADAMSVELMALSFEGVMQQDPQIVRESVVSGSAAQSDIDNAENPFISWDVGRLKEYMEGQGFQVDEFAFSEKLPVLLIMFKTLKDKEHFKMTGINDDVRDILKTTGFDTIFF